MTNSTKKVGKERKDMQKNNELNNYISTITNNFNNTILKIKDIKYHYYLDKLLTTEFKHLKRELYKNLKDGFHVFSPPSKFKPSKEL